MSKLTPHLCALLEEIVEKYRLEPLDSVLAGARELDEAERNLLIDVLVLEFTATGLRADDEPNERGDRIEMLVDFFGAARGRTASKKRDEENPE